MIDPLQLMSSLMEAAEADLMVREVILATAAGIIVANSTIEGGPSVEEGLTMFCSRVREAASAALPNIPAPGFGATQGETMTTLVTVKANGPMFPARLVKTGKDGVELDNKLIASGETISIGVGADQTVTVTEEYHPGGYPPPAKEAEPA